MNPGNTLGLPVFGDERLCMAVAIILSRDVLPGTIILIKPESEP